MEPLVPAVVDLRDFPYMPLDTVRLRDSRLASHVSGEGFRCAVLLWCVSWHQVPAASLPDDEVLLAQYAGFGRSVREWRKVSQQALYGWIKCEDGRYYHPTVAEKALEAWDQRLAQRWRTECARIKKAAQRNGSSADYPSFEEWKRHFNETGSEHWCPSRVPGPVPKDNAAMSPGTSSDVPREMGSKGREGKGRDIDQEQDVQLDQPGCDTAGSPPAPPADLQTRRTQRTAQVTDEAISAYNRILAKPTGLLAAVHATVGRAKRQQQVTRCLKTASEICQDQFGDSRVVPEFWESYFTACAEDDFHSGRGPYGGGHANWRPDFEFLTRPAQMLKVFDRATAEDEAA